MNSQTDQSSCWDSHFYGSVTVGERGQIVIPVEARQEFGFNPGDKLIVMRHPVNKGLMIFKMESVRQFLDEFDRNLREIEQQSKEEG